MKLLKLDETIDVQHFTINYEHIKRLIEIYKDRGFKIVESTAKYVLYTKHIDMSLDDNTIYAITKDIFNIDWIMEYKGRIDIVDALDAFKKYIYELYEVEYIDGKKIYTQVTDSMSRKEFEADRDNRQMDYMQYSGEESFRHTTDIDGKEWCYKESIDKSKSSKREDKIKIFNEFLDIFIDLNNIKQIDTFREIVSNDCYDGSGFNKDFYSVDSVVEYFEDRPMVLKLLQQ